MLLAIPSVVIGWLTVGPVLFHGYFDGAIVVRPAHDVLGEVGRDYRSPLGFMLHAFLSLPVYLAAAGVLLAWFLYLKRPDIPATLRERLKPLYRVLDNKYWFDWVNENVIAAGSRAVGRLFWHVGDEMVIDGALVNGSARSVGWLAAVTRHVAVGLPVPLRVRDDHRPFGAARVAPLAGLSPDSRN